MSYDEPDRERQLVASFDEREVTFKADDSHSSASWDDAAVFRPCLPQLSTDDDRAHGIEFRLNRCRLAN